MVQIRHWSPSGSWNESPFSLSLSLSNRVLAFAFSATFGDRLANFDNSEKIMPPWLKFGRDHCGSRWITADHWRWFAFWQHFKAVFQMGRMETLRITADHCGWFVFWCHFVAFQSGISDGKNESISVKILNDASFQKRIDHLVPFRSIVKRPFIWYRFIIDCRRTSTMSSAIS